MFWLWLLGAAGLALLEVLAGGRYFLCLAGGSLGAALTAWWVPRYSWAQVMTFCGLGALAVTYLLPWLGRRFP